MKKKYIRPQIETSELELTAIMAGSDNSVRKTDGQGPIGPVIDDGDIDEDPDPQAKPMSAWDLWD